VGGGWHGGLGGVRPAAGPCAVMLYHLRQPGRIRCCRGGVGRGGRSIKALQVDPVPITRTEIGRQQQRHLRRNRTRLPDDVIYRRQRYVEVFRERIRCNACRFHSS
jgi:hypothetical protein